MRWLKRDICSLDAWGTHYNGKWGYFIITKSNTRDYKSDKKGVENHLIWESELIWSSRPIIRLEDEYPI